MKEQFRDCRLQIRDHAIKRLIERNFPINKLRKMIFKARWFPHIEEERVTCICREEDEFWTIIIAPTKKFIFIITVYESNNSEINQFHEGKEINTFDLMDNGD